MARSKVGEEACSFQNKFKSEVLYRVVDICKYSFLVRLYIVVYL